MNLFKGGGVPLAILSNSEDKVARPHFANHNSPIGGFSWWCSGNEPTCQCKRLGSNT